MVSSFFAGGKKRGRIGKAARRSDLVEALRHLEASHLASRDKRAIKLHQVEGLVRRRVVKSFATQDAQAVIDMPHLRRRLLRIVDDPAVNELDIAGVPSPGIV